MTLVYYAQVKNGKTYPKQRGGKRLAFVNDVYRKGGKVYSKYLGIREAPAGVDVEEHSPKKVKPSASSSAP